MNLFPTFKSKYRRNKLISFLYANEYIADVNQMIPSSKHAKITKDVMYEAKNDTAQVMN